MGRGLIFLESELKRCFKDPQLKEASVDPALPRDSHKSLGQKAYAGKYANQMKMRHAYSGAQMEMRHAYSGAVLGLLACFLSCWRRVLETLQQELLLRGSVS